MKLFVGYATSEGQTRKIARHVADRLVELGHGVELLPLSDGKDIDLSRFDGIILGASVHIGHYQAVLSEFVSDQEVALAQMPTLLLSVSLAAAGHDAEDWRGLNAILTDFKEATGWMPGRVEQVGGAYMPSKYDVVRRFIMRRIVAKQDPEADLDWDKEYTDWDALDNAVDEWLVGIQTS